MQAAVCRAANSDCRVHREHGSPIDGRGFCLWEVTQAGAPSSWPMLQRQSRTGLSCCWALRWLVINILHIHIMHWLENGCFKTPLSLVIQPFYEQAENTCLQISIFLTCLLVSALCSWTTGCTKILWGLGAQPLGSQCRIYASNTRIWMLIFSKCSPLTK